MRRTACLLRAHCAVHVHRHPCVLEGLLRGPVARGKLLHAQRTPLPAQPAISWPARAPKRAHMHGVWLTALRAQPIGLQVCIEQPALDLAQGLPCSAPWAACCLDARAHTLLLLSSLTALPALNGSHRSTAGALLPDTEPTITACACALTALHAHCHSVYSSADCLRVDHAPHRPGARPV